MSIFAEAAKVARSCVNRSPSGNCVGPTTAPSVATSTTTAEISEKYTFMGYVKQFIASVEIWHLNVFSTVIVLVFVYFQFRSMFVTRLRPKQIKQESFNQKSVRQKEFADKQVNYILFIWE